MVTICPTLENFQSVDTLFPIMKGFPKNCVLENGVFFSEQAPCCPVCGGQMVHNGYNIHTKKGVCQVKLGKYHCPHCHKNTQESPTLFRKLLKFFEGHLVPFLRTIRTEKVAYLGIEVIMKRIFPLDKDTIYSLINSGIDETTLPKPEDRPVQIIGNDEQFPSTGGKQRVRITIVDLISGIPYIDVIVDSKNSETIKSVFLQAGVSFTKPTIIVTDIDQSYPKILHELFGDNFIHQPCLFHLQQLICKSFKKNCSIHDELLKYKFLNVFYNHDKEIEWLSSRLETEDHLVSAGDKSKYRHWLFSIKSEFRIICNDLKKSLNQKGRRQVRTYFDIVEHQLDLMENIDEYSPELQKRLKMMDKKFIDLTNFCESQNIPTTNNFIENYFFRTLNTNWKKRMRTDKGLINHLKLQFMRIQGYFSNVDRTIPQILHDLWNVFPIK
jgi:hypothetical protein